MDPLRTAKGGMHVSDDLVAEVADSLAVSGEYFAQIELVPTQRLVDFHWAAHHAGRPLSLKIQVDVHVPKDADDTRAVVRVRPRRDHRPH